MEWGLTELEMSAVLELIQLSGFPVRWVDFPAEKDGLRDTQSEEGNSAGGSLTEPVNSASAEALPRRGKRLRSLADIYRNTRPLDKNRAKKRARIF
ncbi:Unknown protein [Striga hermonthica]|uniref:Uncharacterized protein n=1 Tax=Striga hermonthica TaxID=68872 RepID=A0A9N7R0V1_STRHE|nr:Unknown protein [Striga hermonthica]